MRDPIPKDSFPFRVIRYVGVILLVVGIIAAAVNLGDVIYTAAKYTSGCDNTDYNGEPCSNSFLKWTWTASGLWGGLLFIATGYIGWRLYDAQGYYLRFFRDAFAVLVVLGTLIIGPAMVALSILELIYGMDIFYATQNGNFVLHDAAKFVLPVVNVSAAFVLWVTATVASVFVCCCAHFIEEYDDEDHYATRYDDRRPMNDYSPGPPRDEYYSSRRRSPNCRRSRRVKRLERGPSSRRPVDRISPQRPRTYDYAMPRRALPAAPFPAMPLPANEPPYMLSASNLSLGSMARPMYASPYASYSFGAPWSG